jgi:hypothetical protein
VLCARKLSLSRFPVLLRCAHDASVMLSGVRDRETHSVGKRLPVTYSLAHVTLSFQSTNGP